jgi:hypothetical protein
MIDSVGAILFDAPIEVLEERAKFLQFARQLIPRDVVHTREHFADDDCFDAAARSYTDRICSKIPGQSKSLKLG